MEKTLPAVPRIFFKVNRVEESEARSFCQSLTISFRHWS